MLDPSSEELAQRVAQHLVEKLARAVEIPDPDEYLTPDGAAQLLKTSAKTLEDYRSKGTGPAFARVNHRLVRYRRGDLLDWMAQYRVEG